MSNTTCEASCHLAREALKSLLEDGNSIHTLNDISINRMLVCGKCSKSGIDSKKVKQVFRSSFLSLAEKVSRYDEWGPNPELTHQKQIQSRRRYREKHKDRYKEYMDDRTIDARIKKLRGNT